MAGIAFAMRRYLVLVVVLTLGIALGAIGNQVLILNAQQPARKVTELLKTKMQGLPDFDAYVVQVEIAPGAESGKHFHPGHDFMYILDGSAIVERAGKPPLTMKPGDILYNTRDDIHNAKNGSTTAPLKVLGVLLIDKDKPLTIPAP